MSAAIILRRRGPRAGLESVPPAISVSQRVSSRTAGNGDGISIGRSYRDAPEIDGMVLVKGIIEPGTLLDARVTGALMHDLIAIKKLK